MEELKEFSTKDLGLAVSLMADNVKYLRVEIEANDDTRARKRLIFVFEANEEIQRIQSQRANDTHVVSSTRYEDCQRRLKSIIHSV
jgi:hypothetical protein